MVLLALGHQAMEYHAEPCHNINITNISMVSCQKGPTRHAYAWQIGPFWQNTLDISVTANPITTAVTKEPNQNQIRHMNLQKTFWSNVMTNEWTLSQCLYQRHFHLDLQSAMQIGDIIEMDTQPYGCRSHRTMDCETGQPLTHWGSDKNAAILQTAFSKGFSWMKIFAFR